MRYLEFLAEKLLAAAAIAEEHFGKVSGTVKPGDYNQVLTDADLAVGKYLVAEVQATYPDHNVIDEEAGGIIAPGYNKLYLAAKGQGATCNGERIQVTQEQNLINTLVSFGIDGYQDDPERTRRECEVLADIVLAVRNMRNSGCEALDPMYVAEGRYGGRVNTTGRIWDSVAPQIIAEEAGALWTTANGQPVDYSDPFSKMDLNFPFCVASPALHRQLQAAIRGRLES